MKNEHILAIFQGVKRNLINHQKHHFMNYWKMQYGVAVLGEVEVPK